MKTNIYQNINFLAFQSKILYLDWKWYIKICYGQTLNLKDFLLEFFLIHNSKNLDVKLADGI